METESGGGVGCAGSEVRALPPPLQDDNRACLFSLPSDVCMSYTQTWGCFQAESGPGGGGLTKGSLCFHSVPVFEAQR